MLIFLSIMGAAYLFVPSSSIKFIDIITPAKKAFDIKNEKSHSLTASLPTSSVSLPVLRRYDNMAQTDAMSKIEQEHDKHLKTKISILVQQTIHDTTKKIESIQKIKAENRDKAAYKAGFLVNLIKKSKDVVNELFSVGVKHKDDWKALEQMKTYELLVHANVDTDNLVKQLMELHNSNKDQKDRF